MSYFLWLVKDFLLWATVVASTFVRKLSSVKPTTCCMTKATLVRAANLNLKHREKPWVRDKKRWVVNDVLKKVWFKLNVIPCSWPLLFLPYLVVHWVHHPCLRLIEWSFHPWVAAPSCGWHSWFYTFLQAPRLVPQVPSVVLPSLFLVSEPPMMLSRCQQKTWSLR